MNNRIIILWLVSIGAAFFLGYFISPAVKPSQAKSSLLIEQPEITDSNAQAKVNTSLIETAKQKKLTLAVLIKPDLNILVDDLKGLLGGGQFSLDMASIAKAYGLIENLTKDELLTTLSLMKGELSKQGNIQLLSLLTGRLATLDPIEAVNFIEKNIDAPPVSYTHLTLPTKRIV